MTTRSLALVASLALLTGLSACATATPYQPLVRGQAISGGFSEARLESDRFRVSFAGNALTSRETVETYLLYRAAELTLAQGYDTFAVVERQTDRDVRTYVEPDPLSRRGPYDLWQPYWRYFGAGYGWRGWDPFYGDPFWADRMDVRTVEKFEATAEIVLRKGPKATGDTKVFDAREVIANLGPKVLRPNP